MYLFHRILLIEYMLFVEPQIVYLTRRTRVSAFIHLLLTDNFAISMIIFTIQSMLPSWLPEKFTRLQISGQVKISIFYTYTKLLQASDLH